ncbi:hypothetical protein F4820DRAFT_444688 [Hypoxylon rubiginosum]|uniref:Uncharacterized protein n=1 Tax=Hypoxylon rubiginosum TaxID=110542 RepID=A0ACB9ZCA1_9PEZI|nr:hypothetical protein F4820DRAFT_444688 [Hypoxylon rubiginosum]
MAKQKAHVYNQYADVLTTGAAIASNRLASLGKYGPFADLVDYFTFIADLRLDLTVDGQLFPEDPKEAFLFYKLLKSRAAPILATASASASGFFLKHVDNKGDHILVDENYNITGIFDWPMARLIPACEAFDISMSTANPRYLCNGPAGLRDDDKRFSRVCGRKQTRQAVSLRIRMLTKQKPRE